MIGTATIEATNLQFPETIYSGYDNVVKEKILKQCDQPVPYSRNVPVWYIVCVSENFLGNARIIPFVSAMLLIPLTYLISLQFTKNPRVSILAAFLMALNPLFLIFDDSSAYSQIWAVAMLGAVYMANKKPILSLPLFLFAIIAKPMAILFIPAMLALTWKNKPVFYAIALLSVLSSLTVLLTDSIIEVRSYIQIPNFESFQKGLDDIWWNITKHLTVLFIPVIILSLVHKNRMVQFLIISSILEVALLPMFTIYTTFPYRLLPLMAFVSIGVSISVFGLTKKNKTIIHV